MVIFIENGAKSKLEKYNSNIKNYNILKCFNNDIFDKSQQIYRSVKLAIIIKSTSNHFTQCFI